MADVACHRAAASGSRAADSSGNGGDGLHVMAFTREKCRDRFLGHLQLGGEIQQDRIVIRDASVDNLVSDGLVRRVVAQVNTAEMEPVAGQAA